MSISTFTTRYSLAVRVFFSLRLVTVLTCSYHRLLVLMYDRNVVSLVPINSCNSVLLSVFPLFSPFLIPRLSIHHILLFYISPIHCSYSHFCIKFPHPYNLLRASVVHRVVHDVQCWLAVHKHLNRYSHPIFPLHSELELAQKTNLLCCC